MNKKPFNFSRRQIIRGILATGAFGITAKFGTGCTPAPENTTDTNQNPGTNTTTTESKPLIVGFIYVGAKDDFGYNQAHAEGAAGISKISGVKIVEQENVPETNEVQEAMRSMIEQDGATVIFPTSFGYFDPHVIKMAEEFPDIQFLHCGGLYKDGVHPKNIGTYFGYIDEAQYVAGIVAAHTSKTGKLGFIAAKPIPQVLRNINSFTLGARSIKPEVTTQVVFTGDWAEPIKEAESANSMADQGIDVLTSHVDSPKVIVETAEKRGIFSSGYHASQASLAPKGFLTGAEWNWTNVYTKYVEMLQSGKMTKDGSIPHLVRGGFKEGFLKLTPYGVAVSEAAKTDAESSKAKFMDGTMVIYKGGLKDNKGTVIIPEGKDMVQTSIELEKMNWLVEGVVGSVSS